MGFSWGPIALHGFVHLLSTTGPSLTKVVYAHFDRISYIYIINHIIYTVSYIILDLHIFATYFQVFNCSIYLGVAFLI